MPQRTALVTGGTRGIGKAICLELAKADFHVVIGARTIAAGASIDSFSDGEPLPGSLEQTRAEIEAFGGSASFAVMDLLENASVEAAADAALADRGRIDVLVNNAIMSTAQSSTMFTLDFSMEMFQREMQVNFFGALALIKRVLPNMLENGGGRVVNMSGAFVLPQPARARARRSSPLVHREQGRPQPRGGQPPIGVRPSGDTGVRRRPGPVSHREGRQSDDRARLRPLDLRSALGAGERRALSRRCTRRAAARERLARDGSGIRRPPRHPRTVA